MGLREQEETLPGTEACRMDTSRMVYVICNSKNTDIGEQKAQILKCLVSQTEGLGYIPGR